MIKKLKKLNPANLLKLIKRSKNNSLAFYSIHNFCRGWFLGRFNPSLLKSNIEIAYHTHQPGNITPEHYHKKADEINLVVSGLGQIIHRGQKHIVCKGEIFVVPRGESITFEALEKNTELIVIKTKSIKGDKYYV